MADYNEEWQTIPVFVIKGKAQAKITNKPGGVALYSCIGNRRQWSQILIHPRHTFCKKWLVKSSPQNGNKSAAKVICFGLQCTLTGSHRNPIQFATVIQPISPAIYREIATDLGQKAYLHLSRLYCIRSRGRAIDKGGFSGRQIFCILKHPYRRNQWKDHDLQKHYSISRPST